MAIEEFVGIVESVFTNSQDKFFLTAVVIVILYLARFVVLYVVFRNLKNTKEQYLWKKFFFYITTAFVLVFLGKIWITGLESLATFLGLVSAGLAITLKDPVSSFAGWIYILVRRPFKMGDRVEIGGIKGDVIDLQMFRFSLVEVGNWVDADQSTGRIVHVPNSRVLTDIVLNYDGGFGHIWNEIPVLLTFESNWKAAKKILEFVAETRIKKFSTSAEKNC